MTGRTDHRRWRAHLAALAVLAALVAVVYGRAAGFDFVFDDGLLVTENAVTTWPLSRAPELLGYSGEGITYRPVRMFSYMADHAIAGGHDPLVFHVSNLVWHLFAAWAVYGFVTSLLGGATGPAFVGAALFTLHPQGSEAVVYVAGRRELLLGLFSVLALWCWWASLERRGAARLLPLAGVGAFSLLALGSKEIAVVIPLLGVLLWVFRTRRAGLPLPVAGSLVPLALGALLVLGVAFFYRAEFLRGWQSWLDGRGLAPQPALTLVVLGHYLGLVAWPDGLQADYRAGAFALPDASMDPAAWVALFGILAWVGAGGWLLWRGSLAGVGLLTCVAGFLPVAQLLPYGEVIAEHNAYLPLVGVALVGADGFRVALARSRPLAIGLAVLLIGLAGARGFVRVPDWRDNITLWRETVAQAPEGARAQHNLAVSYAARGKLLEAHEVFLRALELAPEDPDVIGGLGAIEERLGNHARAEELAHQVLAIRPDVDAMTLLGWSQLGQGKLRESRESFALVLQAAPDAVEGRRGMELVEMRLQRRPPIRIPREPAR